MKHKRFTRALSVLLSLMVVMSALMVLTAIPASAATYRNGAQSGPSSSYKNGRYYSNYLQVPITGDNRTDLVAMALSQLGYQEGAANGSFSGEVSGTANYVEFSYNMGDLGLGYGGSDYPWCASFVSWCLYQSRCTNQATYKDLGRYHSGDYAYIWKEISCSQWVRQLKGAGYFKYSAYEGGSYTPKYGDLVYFQNSGGVAHIGICLYTANGRIYTVEGNTSDSSGLEANGGGVYFKNYALSSSYLYGYGVLPYKSDSSVAKIDYNGANPTPGLYVANASKYIYSSETATSYSYTIPRFSMFEITKIGTNGTRLYGTFKTSSGATVTGWINNNSDRIIQLSSTEGAMSAEEIAREELQTTVNAAKNIRHYNYTEAKILEIRSAYTTAVNCLANTSATESALKSANSTLSALLKETGTNTIALNNQGVYVNGRNGEIGAGDCFVYSYLWNNGLVTAENANIRYTMNVVVKWDDELNCNVVKSVSEGIGSATPSIQLQEGEWLIAAHDWESGISASDNPVVYSGTNFSILKNLEVGSRVYISGATILDTGTDVSPAAYIKFGAPDSTKMTGKDEKVSEGGFVLYTPSFNSGLLTHSNANVHKTLNVVAQWDDAKSAWIVVDKFMGNGKEDESSNIEIVDGKVIISGYASDGVEGSVANCAKLDTAQIGEKVIFSGISPNYGSNRLSISANIDFVEYTGAPEEDEEETSSKNLALSKPYEAETTTAGYNANLTDGVYATKLDYTNKGQWFGFNLYANSKDGVGYITVDLEKVYSLESFRIHFSHDDYDAGVAPPAYVEVATSVDGNTYTYQGNLAVKASASAAYWADLSLDSNEIGRYVRFCVYNNAQGYTWNMLNEVEVYGTTLKGGENVALQRDQIATAVPDGYNTSLTDGAADTDISNDKWFGFLNSEEENANTTDNTGEVVIDLGARYSISEIKAHFFAGENTENINAPVSATVYVSIDGNTYAKAGVMVIDPEADAPFWATLTSEDAVGRYVKLLVTTDKGWTLINEVEVYGKAHEYIADNNIALEKPYAAPAFSASPYTASLTDGTASSIFQYGLNNTSWFGFKNTGDNTTSNVNDGKGIVTIDLGGQAEITGTKVHLFAGANDAGATQPEYINVYISDDGKAFDYVTYLEIKTDKIAPYWAEITLSEPVYARYIKYAVGVKQDNLTLLNEIKVSGTMLTSSESNEPGSMSTITLVGAFNDWNATPNMQRTDDANVSVSMELAAGRYEFKILEGSKWYGNDGVIDNTTATTSPIGWEMTEAAGNCVLNATGGMYTFLYNPQTKMLKVLHTDDTYYIRGTFNEWGTIDILTEDANGNYSKTLILEAGTYEFKAANEDYTKQWPEFNRTLTLDRKTDVTFTLNIFTNELYVYLEVNDFVVKFTDFDGTVLSTQLVRKGGAATAPDSPERKDYRFTGWNKSFENITEDIVIKAMYMQTHGELKVDVAGGAGFTISVNGGAARPQGTAYHSSRFLMGTEVTVTALNSANDVFVGWVNADNGSIVSESLSYTFVTSGKDNLKAVFNTPVEGVNVVVFKNDKQQRILDIQYYAYGDEIAFPAEPLTTGFDFAGWDHTEAEIQAKLAKGEDVTVLAVWTVKQLYFSAKINGGEVIAHGDMDKEGNFLAYRGVTVKANDASEGMKFVCWVDHNGNIKSYDAEYKFYIAENTELTAVYIEESADFEYKVLVDVVMDTASDATSNTILFSWNVPEETGYTFVKAGILLTPLSDYDELTFEVGTDDLNVTQYSPKTEFQIPANTFSVSKKGVNSGDTWVVKSWVQYLNAKGELCVAYSNLVVATKL